MRLPLILTLLLMSVALPAGAAVDINANGQQAAGQEKGWFWQYWYQLQQKEQEQEAHKSPDQKQQEKQDACQHKATWSASCGFVNPKGDYAFQSKERDGLTQQAVMNPNDSQAVKGMQQYTAWAVNQAFTMMQMWQYNQVQDQSLNPFIANPVASFALLAMTDKRLDKRKSVMQEIKDQGGFLVWFTRATCEACAISAPVMRGLGTQSGLPIYEASLGGGCHPGFVGQFCHQGPEVTRAAGVLRVRWVPDLWLYLPKQNGWVRVSSGMEANDAILARIQLFFGGVQNAVAQGMTRATGENSLPVNFNNDPSTVSDGVIGTGVTP